MPIDMERLMLDRKPKQLRLPKDLKERVADQAGANGIAQLRGESRYGTPKEGLLTPTQGASVMSAPSGAARPLRHLK